MLKVGDKVVLSNGKSWSKSQKYRTIKKVFKDGYFLEGDALKYGIEELKLYKENNMKELTFKEVITNIKEDEVWESNDVSIFKTKDDISIDWKNGGDNGVLIFDDEKFKLKRKQYNFEEAFKFFEKGREIESVVSEKCFKIRDSVSVYIAKDKTINTVNDEIRLFTHNEIRGKWYIND